MSETQEIMSAFSMSENPGGSAVPKARHVSDSTPGMRRYEGNSVVSFAERERGNAA